MADTYTTNLNLTKPEPGAAEDTWGISLNSDLDTLDAIFSSSGTQVNLNPNQVNFADGKKAVFGTGGDLEIYHEAGVGSWIKEVGAGDLNIQAHDNLRLQNTASENYLKADSDGAVTLYYDNVAKIATTSTGIDVTGTVTSDGVNTDGNLNIISGQLQLGGSTTITNNKTAYLKGVYVSDAQPTLRLTDTDATNQYTDFFMSASYALFQNRNNTANGGFIFRGSNGSVNTEYMRILPSGNIGIGTTTPNLPLHVESSIDYLANFRSTDTTAGILLTDSNAQCRVTNTNGNLILSSDINNEVANTAIRFMLDTSTNSGNDARVVIREAGLGIGVASPSNPLHVYHATTNQLLRLESGDSTSAALLKDNTGETLYQNVGGIAQIVSNNSGSGTDGIRFVHQSTEVGRFDSSGNFGIGDSSPDAKLTVQGDVLARDEFRGEVINYSSNQNSPYLIASTSGYTGATTDWNTYGFQHRFKTDSGGTPRITIDTHAGEAFAVTNNRNVGIGTSTPNEKLAVNGNILVTGTSPELIVNDNDSTPTPLIRFRESGTTAATIKTTSQNLIFAAGGGTEKARIDSSGNFGIGTSSPNNKLTVSGASDGINIVGTNSFVRWNSGNMMIRDEGSYAMGFHTYDGSTGQVERMRITSAGEVLVGTTDATTPSTNAKKVVVGSTTNGDRVAYGLNVIDGATNYRTELFLDDSNATYGLKSAASAGNVAFTISQGSTEQLRVDTIGRLGIGTSSPSTGMHLSFGDSKAELTLERTGTNASSWGLKPYNGDFFIRESGTDRVTVKAGGNVGIGTTSPARNLHVHASNFTDLHLTNDTTGATASDGTSFSAINSDIYLTNREAGNMVFQTSGTERARIDSSGNFGIGTSSPQSLLHLSKTDTTTYSATDDNAQRGNGATILLENNTATVNSFGQIAFDSRNSGQGIARIVFLDRGSATTDIAFVTENSDTKAEKMRITGAGNVGIGTDSPSSISNYKILEVQGDTTTTGGIYYTSSSDNSQKAHYYIGGGVGYLGTQTNHPFAFTTNNTERARIDSNGALLVGKTIDSLSVAGATLNSGGTAGKVQFVRSGAEPLALNRLSNDGTMLDFRRDGVTHAQIGILGSASGSDAYFASGSSSVTGTGLRFISVTSSIYIAPCRGDGSTSDDLIDLGSSGSRFDDIYATNGTIQTSDGNEKQDIQELSDAEQRVATACKGLIRRYKFNKAVEEKGDDARYHFGIIAQDLQDAFTAEGLDAGDYGMFISDTYTDDNGIEQTRLGVRYNELLAFIIATL